MRQIHTRNDGQTNGYLFIRRIVPLIEGSQMIQKSNKNREHFNYYLEVVTFSRTIAVFEAFHQVLCTFASIASCCTALTNVCYNKQVVMNV